MGVYDNFRDSPEQIKTEGQEITIKFNRTSDNTARISWNIPPPAHGCSSDTQAYDGIVITISNQPANYLSTSPKDGIYYDGDPTADSDIHSGSKLDGAIVVGAFYHDKTTTFLDVTDIKPKTPYYVSGYAVDNVGRYHREGVHAYSLPTGIQSYVTTDYPAKHDIKIYSTAPLDEYALSGLQEDQTYNFALKMECKRYDIPVSGTHATTYGDLVDELNKQFAMMATKYKAPQPPHTSSYYYDAQNDLVQFYNGSTLTTVNALVSSNDPASPINGAFWLNTTTNTLMVYDTIGWEPVLHITHSTDAPTELDCSDAWYDGTTVRVWGGSHWCDYVTIVSDRNPQLPPILSCDSYWYDSANKEFFKWNEKLKKWDDKLVMYYPSDPNDLNTGDYWYDEKKNKMKQYVGGTWNIISGVVYTDSDINGNYPENHTTEIVANLYWFDTKTQTFYRRNLLNTEWDELTYISYPTNPLTRKSCDVWWNSSESVNDLYVWESASSTWVLVTDFYKQETDPSLPIALDDHTAWVDSTTNEIYLINNTSCEKINFIHSVVDPREIQHGSIWFNGSKYFIYESGGEWNELTDILVSPDDPYFLYEGMLWLSPTPTPTLNKYTTGVWEQQVLYTDKSFLPQLEDQWFDTINNKLYEWNGAQWKQSPPFIKAQFVTRNCIDEYEKIEFSTRKTGCRQAFEILSDNNTVLASLANSVIYMDPIKGYDGIDAGAMYKQLGVGDDGSPDERRKLHDNIRMILGAPSIRIELTKQQIDKCIDNALLMLRKKSSYSYKKGMFFLDLKPNQQVYTLTDRCVGFNKIVDITVIHRMKQGAFKTAYSQNDNFAFAALQQMYTLGTFDILTYHLTSAYVEELEVLFASRIMYQWLERKRELKIYQVVRGKERVLLEAIIERTEQELLNDRETALWIERWAVAEAKSMLAQIRGKFVTLPGPTGSTQLNHADLQTQVETEKNALIEEIESKSMQDLTDIGMKAHFLIG